MDWKIRGAKWRVGVRQDRTMYFSSSHDFGLPGVVLVDQEYERLADLVCASPRATPGIELLWQELQRAERAEATPADVVRLGSLVSFTDLRSGDRRAGAVAAPDQAVERRRISVTSPVGAALIGLKAGDVFRWRGPDGGARAVRIDQVMADPRQELRREAAEAAERRAKVARLLSLA